MKNIKSQHLTLNTHNSKGISLISLIITIIVIIILAAVVIFTGLNTPEKANFVKYTQEVDNLQTAVQDEYSKKIISNTTESEYRTDKQIYYAIATGSEATDTSTLKAGNTTELNLDLYPTNLEGDEFYEVTSDVVISGMKNNRSLSGVEEKHYVTDKGEFFVLPGYPNVVDGVTRWYISANRYYEGEEAKTISSSTENISLTPGQEITLGTEKFYYLWDDENDNSKAVLFAKYNLNTAGTSQAPDESSSTTACRFSYGSYWSDDYVEGLNLNTYTIPDTQTISNNAIMKAQNYASNIVGRDAIGRLLTYQEALLIENGSDDDMKDILHGKANKQGSGDSYYLIYWLGTASSDTSVWKWSGSSGSTGTSTSSYSKRNGVRPVIIISKSEL